MRKQWLIRKKIRAVFLMLCLGCLVFGCGQQTQGVEESSDRLRIVCTIFPEYDWVKQILGEQAEEAELTLLMKNGADLHSYQPTVWDLKKIAEADLFVYVGGESDFWVEAALANTRKPDRITLNLMEILGDAIRQEEHLEGMQCLLEADHEESGHGEAEYDEHVWLSLSNAQMVCTRIKEALCSLDEENRTIYEKNAAAYEEKLRNLDEEYKKAVRQSPDPVLLFGDRFPFLYLARDYGITCYAAFSGCSAETEASFFTITNLAEKAQKQSLSVVLAIDGSDQKIARTIADNTKTRDQKVRILDSMQSVSGREIEEGANYLSIMERNLEVLKEALPAGKGA